MFFLLLMCYVVSDYSNSKLKKETISQNVTEKVQNWSKKFSLTLGLTVNRALNNPAYIVHLKLMFI